MPFITQGKTNWNFLVIVIILAIIVGVGALWYVNRPEKSYKPVEIQKTEEKSAQELGCLNSGGTVSVSSCCKSSNDFPNSCLIGACGCSPTDSHQVKTCDCGEGKCFDGEKCLPIETTPAPSIDSISPSSGPIGTIIEIRGKNFSGFEGDLDAWIENNQAVKGIIYGETGSNVDLIRFTLKSSFCQIDTSYSGLPCSGFLNITPGTYKIYVAPWGQKSNEVTFTVTSP
jgi:hypothetical protein